MIDHLEVLLEMYVSGALSVSFIRIGVGNDLKSPVYRCGPYVSAVLCFFIIGTPSHRRVESN
jgi:hypothetical protein